MALPRTISPQAAVVLEDRRLAYQKSAAVEGYSRRRAFARRAFAGYMASRAPLDLAVANDWIEAANRAAAAAAEFGLTLARLPAYAGLCVS